MYQKAKLKNSDPYSISRTPKLKHYYNQILNLNVLFITFKYIYICIKIKENFDSQLNELRSEIDGFKEKLLEKEHYHH